MDTVMTHLGNTALLGRTATTAQMKSPPVRCGLRDVRQSMSKKKG